MASKASNQLDTKDDKYLEQFDLWEQVRAAIAGKYAVVNIVSCLPSPQYKVYPVYSGMTSEQQQQANACNQANALRVQSYWARGRFFNATGRTAESLDGMIWSQNPEVELSPRLAYLEESADGGGCGLREVVQKITDDVVSIGRYGVLVDMPSNETNLTRAQMEQAANAPRLITYKAEQIIYFRNAGNSKSVDEIRLLETTEVQKSEFQWETEVRIRRLVMRDGIYHNELYNDADELISSTTPIANGANLTEIPFQFFGADNNSPEYSQVPLYDLANANLGHFVLDCDNRDNLHFHGQGMTNVYTEMTPEDFNLRNPNGLDVGAKGRNQFMQGDKVEILQLEATGAIPSEMLRDEQRMIMLGAQLVMDTPSTQTLGAKEMEFGASTSTLKRITRNVSDGVESVLSWVALFLGDSQESTYQLNTDFVTDDLSPEMIGKHMEMVQASVMPRETLYETARKAGFTELDNEELKDLAEKDDLALGGMTEQQAIEQAATE